MCDGVAARGEKVSEGWLFCAGDGDGGGADGVDIVRGGVGGCWRVVCMMGFVPPFWFWFLSAFFPFSFFPSACRE